MTKKNELAEFQAHSHDICEQYLDGQPYDRLRVVNEARFCLAQSAESMLEAGKRLVVLKEHEGHGEFTTIVETQLGIDKRIAQKMMGAACKFLSPKLQGKNHQLLALGKTKLYELMVEDDDDLEALADGGTVAGLELDDIDTMSTRELRKALRKAREDSDAKEQVIADKNKKLDELATKSKKLKTIPLDEQLAQIQAEADARCFDVQCQIRVQLTAALEAVAEFAQASNMDIHAWQKGQLDQIDSALLHLREELGVPRDAEGAPWEEQSA